MYYRDDQPWLKKALDSAGAYVGYVIGYAIAVLLISVPAGLALWLCYAQGAQALGLPLIGPWQMVCAASFVIGAITTIRVAIKIRTQDLG